MDEMEIKEESYDEILEKGWKFYEKGSFKEAFKFFDEIIEKDPKRIEGYRCKGRALRFTCEYEPSIIILNKALEINPKDPISLVNLGMAFLFLKKKEEAMKFFEETISSCDELIKIDKKLSKVK